MTTVAQQSECFLAALVNRRRNPVKSSTLRAYRAHLRRWIIPNLGTLELAATENGAMKCFVTILVEAKLSPATIASVISTLKAVVASATDDSGNRLHPREWNTAFIDAPRVNLDTQNTPVVTAERLNGALRSASMSYLPFYALQAASGLRVSEMMALRMGPDSRSCLDLDKATIFVRSAVDVFKRVEQSTKSPAGVREVDLHPTIVDWLRVKFTHRSQSEYLFQNEKGGIWHLTTLYENIEKDGIPGTHSLRRFRTTHLENMSVPRVLVDYWTGHTGKAITDRYTKLGRSIEARKNWCRRAGLGFQLPGTADNTIVGDLYQKDLLEVL